MSLDNFKKPLKKLMWCSLMRFYFSDTAFPIPNASFEDTVFEFAHAYQRVFKRKKNATHFTRFRPSYVKPQSTDQSAFLVYSSFTHSNVILQFDHAGCYWSNRANLYKRPRFRFIYLWNNLG